MCFFSTSESKSQNLLTPCALPPLPPQEIDGDALLLLKSEMMMKYLGLKLGPALKLCYHIDRLKQSRL